MNLDEVRVGRESFNKVWTAKLGGNIYATVLFQGLARISFGTHQTRRASSTRQAIRAQFGK